MEREKIGPFFCCLFWLTKGVVPTPPTPPDPSYIHRQLLYVYMYNQHTVMINILKWQTFLDSSYTKIIDIDNSDQ